MDESPPTTETETESTKRPRAREQHSADFPPRSRRPVAEPDPEPSLNDFCLDLLGSMLTHRQRWLIRKMMASGFTRGRVLARLSRLATSRVIVDAIDAYWASLEGFQEDSKAREVGKEPV